jgi:predicted ester cyclase
MTHLGEGIGIPPTQRRARTTGMCFCRISNGKFIESRDNWDALGLMEQLGAAPEVKLL